MLYQIHDKFLFLKSREYRKRLNWFLLIWKISPLGTRRRFIPQIRFDYFMVLFGDMFCGSSIKVVNRRLKGAIVGA